MGALTSGKPHAFAERGKKLTKKDYFAIPTHLSSPTTRTLAIRDLRVELKSSGLSDNNDANFKLHLLSSHVIHSRQAKSYSNGGPRQTKMNND